MQIWSSQPFGQGPALDLAFPSTSPLFFLSWFSSPMEVILDFCHTLCGGWKGGLSSPSPHVQYQMTLG
jgi:hypothetical protein